MLVGAKVDTLHLLPYVIITMRILHLLQNQPRAAVELRQKCKFLELIELEKQALYCVTINRTHLRHFRRLMMCDIIL